MPDWKQVIEQRAAEALAEIRAAAVSARRSVEQILGNREVPRGGAQ